MTRKRKETHAYKRSIGGDSWGRYLRRTIFEPKKPPKKSGFIIFTQTVAGKAIMDCHFHKTMDKKSLQKFKILPFVPAVNDINY